jgi:hypothetical protein
MQQTDETYSTQTITPQLVSQIIDTLKNKAYGSVEIYVENYNVIQITERTITKVRRVTTTTRKRFQIIRNNVAANKFEQDSTKPNLVRGNTQQ